MNCHHALLQDEALLHVSGPDALTFLQGQTTCDTRQLEPEQALPGAYCTPQGRLVADFLLTRPGEEHLALRMRRSILAHCAAVLGKYIVFSKAELDAQRDDWRIAGCWGEDAAAVVASVFGRAPQGRYQAVSGEGFVVVQLDDAGSQFECQLMNSREDLLTALTTQTTPAGETAWQALQIEAGIGRLESATVDEFIPQMLNFDLTGHINFNKGCYTGQEVVARLHYRGTPKRRLYRAHWQGDAVDAGTPLYRAASEQSVGNVVNCISTDSGALALVTSTRDGIAEGLLLAAPDGPALATRKPPYPLPEIDGED